MAFIRSADFKPFEKRIWLASPTMHSEEMEYVKDAYDTNWVSTVGKNIDEIERIVCERLGCKYAVALGTGTSALHMALRYVAFKLYGNVSAVDRLLKDKRVFASDLTFAATVNPIVYEGGIPVFIDTERDSWNMDPKALERAFKLYPDVKIVVVADLYGTPAKLDEIKAVCDKNGAVMIEDAAESLGAIYKGRPAGTFGDHNCISFNGNKIITGSSGGMFLTDDEDAALKVRKWSTQSREVAPWYQHEELGYNYRMSNIIAGMVRGQLPHLDEHIVKKKAIYERYKEGFRDIPVSMNPYDVKACEPNFWLSSILIDREAMCEQTRGDKEASYKKEAGKTCPTEILEALISINAEGRPIWKPMHMQPIFDRCDFCALSEENVSRDIFDRGMCLPSDIKMTEVEQDEIIEVVRACFE